MRFGLFPNLSGAEGGVYQYSMTMLNSLYQRESGRSEDEFVVFAHDRSHPAVASLDKPGWSVLPLYPPSLKSRLRDAIKSTPAVDMLVGVRDRFKRATRQFNPDTITPKPELRAWFLHNRIDLMLYPNPIAQSFETGLPYIAAIHDLQHRLQPEFPEFSVNGEWEMREYRMRNVARYATLLLADSEVGKEDIVTCYGRYGVTPDRVKVLPFLPASYLAVQVAPAEQQRVRSRYRLPERYLFYPSQFWPHKNHLRIVEALGLLKQRHNRIIPIVFCGSHTGNLREQTFRDVMAHASACGLDTAIHYLGYIPDEDMSALYAGAVALVMPTFFGPTNIPVLEAWAFGCPVLTSDIRGIREQCGDAVLLADPRLVEAIADSINRLWCDEHLRQTLAERGRQRLARYTPDEYHRRLLAILDDARTRVQSQYHYR